ncbi:MAG: BamA/TamA family outer membrane protein [Ginsengibacter sp.]
MILSILFFVSFCLQAQINQVDSTKNGTTVDSNKKIAINNIVITGNDRTKNYVILREIPFKKGDSIALNDLPNEVEKTRELIYNTTLFVTVNVFSQLRNDDQADIIIILKERWYIFPIPYVELADRSFNDWVKTYDADLKRISYGIYFTHYNFTGRRDPFSLILINGFNRNISFEYAIPYINRQLTKGLKLGAGIEQTRQIPYITDFQNKLIYYKNDRFVQNEWYVTAALTIRKKIKNKETFSVKFRHIDVADSIVTFYNPSYFKTSNHFTNLLELQYKLQYTDVDNVLYPLKGKMATLILKKKGVLLKRGINNISVEAGYEKYTALGYQWFLSCRVKGSVQFPFEPAYFNSRALGYDENYLRGYEYFVIDGFAFGFGKVDLKKRIAKFTIPTGINSATYNKIPFTLYAKTYADAGSSFSREKSKLNNKMLFSGGFGIDIVTLYDVKLGVEFSLNQLGQKGLFLHP